MGPVVHAASSIVASTCTPGLGICQGLMNFSQLRVDILDPSEWFVWTGFGAVSVTSPTGDPVLGADGDNVYASGETISPLLGVTGAYRIALVADQFECPAGSLCAVGGTIQTFHRWDVTVFAAGTPRPGRLWSANWFFNARNFTATQATTASFYALVPGGIADTDAVVELRVDGLAGFLYQVAANRQGPVSLDTLSHGRSLPQAESTVPPEFPIYLNVPERAQYSEVSDDFIDVTDLACSADPVGEGGAIPRAFSFETNVVGTAQIICDLDSPPDGANLTDDDDLVLIAPVTPGSNTISWDGLDGDGNPVPSGPLACIARVTVGEFHYVAADMETSFPGLRMFEVQQDQTRRPLSMFWNDTAVQAGGALLANGQTSPATSPPDGLLPDEGVAVPFSVENPAGNSRAWGEFHPLGSSKGNTANLDTFAWIAGTEQALTLDCASTVNNAPTVLAPPDVTVEAEGPLTTVSLGTATANDTEDGPLTATPNTSGPFALGATIVTWTATDSEGATGTDTQQITVVDTTPPIVLAPPDLLVTADGPLTDIDLGAELASAFDLVDGELTPTPDFTGPFPVGQTAVHWTASDASGNTGMAVQQVLVVEPIVTVEVSTATIAEDGAGVLVFTFARTGSAGGPLAVQFSVGGTATFGADYTQSGAATFAASSGSVLFGAGLATASVVVDPVADSEDEPDETVVLTLASGAGYSVGGSGVAGATILDDDAPAEPLVCDVTGDRVVDISDISLIFAARGQPAAGPDDPRDANGDGLITINDGRICVLRCTNLACAANN